MQTRTTLSPACLLFAGLFCGSPDGQPREELFVSDRLHINEAGYKLWAGIVKPVLSKVASSPETKAGGEKK